VTLGAQVGCAVSEGCRCRVLNVVNAMTVNTGRYVQVAFLGQGGAMNTLLVGIIDGAVTLGTGISNMQAGTIQHLACFGICQALLGMRIMTIGTDRRVLISSSQRLLVDTIQRQVELLGMALLAGCVLLQGDFTQGFCGPLGMRET